MHTTELLIEKIAPLFAELIVVTLEIQLIFLLLFLFYQLI